MTPAPPIARRHPLALRAALLFTAIAGGLLWLHGNRLIFNNDEGIILDAATRMLHGQAPYRDFFAYMSPGSYWLQAAVFRICGITLLAGRIPVILDFALECALLFWMSARFAGKQAAWAVVTLFFAIQAASPEVLLAQHRMDSSALSLASIFLCLEGRRRSQKRYWIAGGLLIAAAAVCTPTIALIALATCVWLLSERPLRPFFPAYAAGAALASAAIAVALAAEGVLVPFIRQMLWLRHNYSGVNVMPYGSLIGGYRAALGAGFGPDSIPRFLAVLCIALPAILPVIAFIAWMGMIARRDSRHWAVQNGIPYLVACMALYAASTYPRADVAHLAFVAVPGFLLTAVFLARYAPVWLRTGAFSVLAAGSALLLTQAARTLAAETAVPSPVGNLRVAATDAPAVQALLRNIHPQDAVYAHPYMPLLYFLTQGQNPTRYSYLAPGMMTAAEEKSSLASLAGAPPKWLLYLPLTRAEFLRVFPHATGLNHQFPAIEAWRERDFEPLAPPIIVGGYRLYQRKPEPLNVTALNSAR